MISHDLGLVANVCRRVAVMYAGRIVEERGSDDIFRARSHPYTQGLVDSLPRLGSRAALGRTRLQEIAGVVPAIADFPDGCRFNPRCARATEICRTIESGDDMARRRRPRQVSSPCMTPVERSRAADDVILSVEDLAVHFPVGGGLFGGGRRLLRAVDGVDLELKRGECLGLVGESGCGKSTVALSILGLQAPTRGRIVLDGQVVTGRQAGDRKALARIVQMVFQDPYASLNPRQTVRRTLEDPLRLHGVTAKSEIDGRVAEMLAACRPAARTGRPLSA